MTETGETAAVDVEPAAAQSPPGWILGICAVAILSMASQTRLAATGLPVAVADVTTAAAFGAMLFWMWRSRARVKYPLALAVILLVYCLANVAAGAGRSGGVEIVQRVEQFFCGLLVFAFILSTRPAWCPRLVGAGLALNVVIALLQGVSGASGARGGTGLFQSTTALSVYIALALAWLQPVWLSRWRGRLGLAGVVIATAAALCAVAHGQVLLIAAVTLVLIGFLHSARAALANLVAVGLAVLCLGVGGIGGGSSRVCATLSPFQNGRIKQCHTELVAAMRMAQENPLTGVGAGKYQEHIGQYYGELPNPNFNLEPDTQAGLGILLATAGFPAGLLFLLLFLLALGRSLEAFYQSGKHEPLFLGAAGCIMVFLACMLISDPLVRGVGWYPVLALASVFGLTRDEADGAWSRALAWPRVASWGACYAVLAAIVVATSAGETVSAGRRAVADAGQVELERSTGSVAGTDPTAVQTLADMDFFRVLDAADAKEITAPVERGQNSRAANQTILMIPDEKGKPPEGEDPELKYGGAVFELVVPRPLTCKVWLRVWWEGACGNSVAVQLGADAKQIVVSDNTYESWHWLEVPHIYELAQGTHQLLLLNREDGIRLDQILVTGDLRYAPVGIEEE